MLLTWLKDRPIERTGIKLEAAKVRELKAQLEQDIYADIVNRVDQFTKETGFYITDLRVNIADVGTFGNPGKRIISQVEIEVKL